MMVKVNNISHYSTEKPWIVDRNYQAKHPCRSTTTPPRTLTYPEVIGLWCAAQEQSLKVSTWHQHAPDPNLIELQGI